MMDWELELQQVGSGTFTVIDDRLGSNAGAVVLDDYIVAIDTTMRPQTARVFRNLLETRFQRPVRFLCVTHYHGDHIFGLSAFKDVAMLASSRLEPNLRRRMAADWSPEGIARWKTEDPSVAEWFDEVEFIFPALRLDHTARIGSQILLHPSGGHTDCSLHAWLPGERVLFAGDLLFSGRVPWAGDMTCDPERWMAVLRDWLTWDISAIVAGHGPITGKDEIRKNLRFLETLKQATLATLAAGGNADQIPWPDTYPVPDDEAWIVSRSRLHWFDYYSKLPAPDLLAGRQV